MVRFSLGFVAICEFLFGGIFVVYFLMACGLTQLPYAHGHTRELVISILFTGTFATFCIWAGLSLLRGVRWAWIAAQLLCVLILAFGVSAIYDVYHPSPKNPDGYFGILIGPPLILISAAGLVLLNLRTTRRSILSGKLDLYSAGEQG